MKKLAVLGFAMALTSAVMVGQAFAADQEVIVDGFTDSYKFGVFEGKVVTNGTSYQEIFEVDVADLTQSPGIDESALGVNPIGSVSLTINGKTQTFTPTASDVIYSTSPGLTSWTMDASAGPDQASFDVGSLVAFNDPFRSPLYLSVEGPVYAVPGYYSDFVVGGKTDSNVGLVPASVFPEPPVWGLMIGGVALAGLLLRRKPETDSLAAAVVA